MKERDLVAVLEAVLKEIPEHLGAERHFIEQQLKDVAYTPPEAHWSKHGLQVCAYMSEHFPKQDGNAPAWAHKVGSIMRGEEGPLPVDRFA